MEIGRIVRIIQSAGLRSVAAEGLVKCSDLGVPAPYGCNIAPISVYLRRGCMIGESQERVARAKPLQGDEVDQIVEL